MCDTHELQIFSTYLVRTSNIEKQPLFSICQMNMLKNQDLK